MLSSLPALTTPSQTPLDLHLLDVHRRPESLFDLPQALDLTPPPSPSASLTSLLLLPPPAYTRPCPAPSHPPPAYASHLALQPRPTRARAAVTTPAVGSIPQASSSRSRAGQADAPPALPRTLVGMAAARLKREFLSLPTEGVWSGRDGRRRESSSGQILPLPLLGEWASG